jgi:hypothetical protein
MLIPFLLDGTVTANGGSFLESFMLNAERFSGAFAAWRITNEIFGATGSLVTFLLGMLLVLAVVIPMFTLLVALRKNVPAARTILIVNLCICALGNWLCWSVINRISNAIGVLQPPYDNIPLTALITAAVVAILWITGAVYYSSLAAKSKRFTQQQR